MNTYTSIHSPELFQVRPTNEGPRLWIGPCGQATIFFHSWKQFEKLKDECNRAWYAFQTEEEQRLAKDQCFEPDTASKDGDRNSELTAAMGGSIV